MNGNVLNGNGSESFLYGQQQGSGPLAVGGTARGMGVYDQMERVGEQDEGGHGRKGFWAALCCRA